MLLCYIVIYFWKGLERAIWLSGSILFSLFRRWDGGAEKHMATLRQALDELDAAKT